MEITFSTPCLMGIEGILAGELRYLGAQQVEPQNGRVLFRGGEEMLARVNLCSRYAERVQILLGSFQALSFEELFQGVRALPWERWIDKKDAFPVKGRSLSSALYSVPDCQSIIKKAVVERLKQKYKLEWFEETGALHQIQFLFLKDTVNLLLDTSGAGLHKRGYRANSTEAPIKETLAAARVDIARVRPFSQVYDPFCGSGTFLIESALKARNIAPGLNRRFSAERWEQIPASFWREERQRAGDNIRKDTEFEGFGFDVDPAAVNLTLENAKLAGVADCIRAECREISDFSVSSEKALILTNPPYGERLLDLDAAREIYRRMGKVFPARPGVSAYIISPDEEFETYFGRRADKKRKLYNGMIKCDVYQYFK